MKNVKKTIYATLFILFIISIWYLRLDHHITRESIRASADQLRLFVSTHYAQSIALYCVLFIVATIAAIPITVALTIAGGFLFGTILGSILAVFCATFGAMCLFVSMRYIFADWVQKKYTDELRALNEKVKADGAKYLLIAQLLPFTPSPLINICAGLLPISLWTFTWATAVGILPGTVLYAWFGRFLQ